MPWYLLTSASILNVIIGELRWANGMRDESLQRRTLKCQNCRRQTEHLGTAETNVNPWPRQRIVLNLILCIITCGLWTPFFLLNFTLSGMNAGWFFDWKLGAGIDLFRSFRGNRTTSIYRCQECGMTRKP